MALVIRGSLWRHTPLRGSLRRVYITTDVDRVQISFDYALRVLSQIINNYTIVENRDQVTWDFIKKNTTSLGEAQPLTIVDSNLYTFTYVIFDAYLTDRDYMHYLKHRSLYDYAEVQEYLV